MLMILLLRERQITGTEITRNRSIYENTCENRTYGTKLYAITILRMAIGWHFLYEGLAKLFTPSWTSADYLMLSNWIFSGFFHGIASNSVMLQIADFLVIWGLILIGLALFLGLFDRIAALAGMFLIALFWLANPPLTMLDFGLPREGNYLIVDKNLVEFFALLVLRLLPTGSYLGLQHMIRSNQETVKREMEPAHAVSGQPEKKPDLSVMLNRRSLLRGLSSCPSWDIWPGSPQAKKMGEL